MENSLQQIIGCKSQKGKRKMYDDGIWELPDEILEDIVSRLPMREAARTSVLSRRWKYIWTYTTTGFDFDFEFCNEDSYISKVNKILKAHNGSTIKEFRVKFYLNATHQSLIDTWIDFAFHKRVEQLELQLSDIFPFQRHNLYTFKLNTDMDLTFLTSLRLNNVNVTGDVIEHILANCSSLQELVIIQSPSLTGVRVIVPCPKLKYMGICNCDSFKYLHIYSAPNLKAVSYAGPEHSSLSFTNVPNLSCIQLWENYPESLVSRFEQLPVQVEILLLSIEVVLPGLYNLPRLKNVKYLDLLLSAAQSLVLPCSSILEACPNLQKLLLRFVMSADRFWEDYGVEQAEQLGNYGVHKNLKEIEVMYFVAKRTELDVVTYLLSTAPFLERIIFHSFDALPFALHDFDYIPHHLVPAAEVILLFHS